MDIQLTPNKVMRGRDSWTKAPVWLALDMSQHCEDCAPEIVQLSTHDTWSSAFDHAYALATGRAA